MFMRNRTVIKIISFLLALILSLLVFLYKFYKKSKSYENEIRYTYSRSFDEFENSLNNIKTALDKAAYVTTATQISNIATNLMLDSRAAKQAFSQLPTGQQTYENVNKFLSQVGNYSSFLASKVIGGGEITEEERNNLELLSAAADTVSKNVSQMQIIYNNTGYWNSEIEKNVNTVLESGDLSGALADLEENIVEYPTLLYDGPYSDYISIKESQLIKTSETVTEEEAKQIAAKAIGIDAAEFTTDGYDNGKIPAYNFVYGSGVASVSINGGYLIYFREYTEEQPATLSYQQAVSKAQKYVGEHFGGSFISNYYFTDNGVCVINFAYKNGAVICYTDLIKVGVDMSSGDVVLYEARGFITNHHERTIETPVYTVEQAMEVLSPALAVKSHSLALIPTDGGYERLCYEFVCNGNENDEILVYIDVATLQEAEIFMLLKTDGGTLTK